MNVGQRMKARRKELKISADEIAKELGVSRSTIFRYEKGDIEKLPTQNLAVIAKVLKTTPEELMGWETSQEDITTIYNKLEPKRQKKVYSFAEAQLHSQNKVINLFDHKETVQVTAKVAAGEKGHGITWLGDSTYDKEVTSKPKHYDEAFEINGDSMTPLFKDGEVIFVEHTEIVENGQIAVVQIDDESFIKKVYIEEDKMRLVSLNKDYEDIIVESDCDIRIVGKVIM